MSGTPTTFEPDVEALARAGNNAGYGQHFIHDDAWLNAKYSAVIAEYQRQAAAAGLVMVPERALRTIFDKAREYYHFWREDEIADRDAIAAVLGVKPAPAPGGDER